MRVLPCMGKSNKLCEIWSPPSAFHIAPLCTYLPITGAHMSPALLLLNSGNVCPLDTFIRNASLVYSVLASAGFPPDCPYAKMNNEYFLQLLHV